MASPVSSQLKKYLLVSGIYFFLLLLFIISGYLIHKYLMGQSNLGIADFEYFLILGMLPIIFTGLLIAFTLPFINQGLFQKTKKIFQAENNSELNNISDLKDAKGLKDTDLTYQHKSINALLTISETGENPVQLKLVLHQALRVVQDVTGFSTIVIRLLDVKKKFLRIAAQQGMSVSMLDELESVEADKGIVSRAINSLWPVPIEDLAMEDPEWVGVSPALSGFRSVVCIPLVSGQEAIGSMELASKTQYSWNLDELRWLALVGRIIGSIANRVSLTEHLRDFAALQERSRLAQELHDGLVQVIGSIRLWSEDARESLESKEYTSAQQAVTRIESLSSDAYASLRDELLGLRDTLDSNRDLPSVIKEYLSRFKRQWGIETRLMVDESEGAKTNLVISPATEIQLLRIFQEALTNTRRHAEATKVDVCLSADNDYLRITIQDNGRGFYPDKVSGDHLGINIMRERAASVQGNITLESEPGLGTKIQIVLPRQHVNNDSGRDD